MTRPVEPVFGVHEGVENLDWLQALLDQGKGVVQPLRVGHRLNGRQDRFTVLEAEITIVWKSLIRCVRPIIQLVTKLRDERLRPGCNAGLLAVAGQLTFDLLLRQELKPVIPELVGFRNAQVSGLKIVGYLRYY